VRDFEYECEKLYEKIIYVYCVHYHILLLYAMCQLKSILGMNQFTVV